MPEPLASPLDGLTAPGAFGLETAEPPLALAEGRGLSIVQVMARPRRASPASKAVEEVVGLRLPGKPGRANTKDGARAIWIQPGHWLVVTEGEAEGALHRRLAEALGDSADLIDQSHSRTLVTVSGPAAEELLGRGCRIDLHRKVFRTGSTATALIGHLAVIVHRREAERFDLYPLRTYARDFWGWLVEHAAPFGYRVD